MISQEEIYQYLKNENWKELIGIFYDNKDLIKKDNLLTQALETTLFVITDKATKFDTNNEFIDNCEMLIMLHISKFICLKDIQKEAITVAIVNGKQENISYSYNYAKEYPNNDICLRVIKEFEKKQPQKIEHTQIDRLNITENQSIIENCDFRKPLFNSLQEVEFFLALKRVFDTYQVYPNISLSSIIDFNKIKSFLDKREQEFFFKSTVDFVVLEPFRNYLPIHFFEIDSVWHDNKEQQERDQIKDKIFSLSGQKLYRIRKIDNSIDEEVFEKLIIEIRDRLK